MVRKIYFLGYFLFPCSYFWLNFSKVSNYLPLFMVEFLHSCPLLKWSLIMI